MAYIATNVQLNRPSGNCGFTLGDFNELFITLYNWATHRLVSSRTVECFATYWATMSLPSLKR
jgi:hypothetical protein